MATKVKIVGICLTPETIKKADKLAKKYHSRSALVEHLIISEYTQTKIK